MAAKPKAKVAKAKVANGNLCEAGGDEIRALIIPARTDSIVELRVTVCRTAAWLYGELDGTAIVDQEVRAGVLAIGLGRLTPGRHHLLWQLIETAKEWQAKSEVIVDGVARFRHRKSNTSELPLPKWLLGIEVQA